MPNENARRAQIELGARILVPHQDDTVDVRFVSCGRLRCSAAAAVHLRNAIDASLKMLEQPQPNPVSHNSSAGTGSQAQAFERPGTLTCQMLADTVVELGPGKVLSGLVRRIDKGLRTYAVEDPAGLKAVLGEVFK